MDIDHNSKDSASKFDRDKFNHIIEIIKTAFPYLDSDSQQSVDLFIKTGELVDALHSYRQRNSVTTFSLKKQDIDIETLLTNVRDVCYDQEKELIDIVLNIIKAKNLYDTYSAFASTMASQSENADNPDGTPTGNGNPDMMEILGSLLTPEQKSTFDDINTMFNTMQ